MSKEEKNVEEILEEQDDYYSNDDLYNITSWGADLSFRELITQYKEGDLVKPELQRRYVWDKAGASRFIDSVLLGLPIPSIFLAKASDERMLIIDGYQRIMTVHDFVTGIFSEDNKVFKLSNSEKINKKWRGKAFSELVETEQRKIRNTTIHAIIFVQKQPHDNDTSMYQVFERINTGGRTLLPQEIRNCVYQGGLNSLLIELNKYKKWRSLYGLEGPDSRMRDMEFILRFLAFRSEKILKANGPGRISLKRFLNEFMGMEDNGKEQVIESCHKSFVETVELVHGRFGLHAFHNISGRRQVKFINKFNPTIFDSLMVATHLAAKKGIIDTKDKNYEELQINLLQEQKYQDLIRIRTTDVDRIQHRIAAALKHLYDLEYQDVV